MVRVTMRICWLCYDIGVNKKATHTYVAGDGESYDICPKCKENVDKAGLDSWEISNPIREVG